MGLRVEGLGFRDEGTDRLGALCPPALPQVMNLRLERAIDLRFGGKDYREKERDIERQRQRQSVCVCV